MLSYYSVSANLEQYNEYDLWINSDEDISPGECVLATCETAADSNLRKTKNISFIFQGGTNHLVLRSFQD